MTDTELIRRFDKARRRRNQALDDLEPLHTELMTRVIKAGGVIRTKAGYATVTYTTMRVKDAEAIKKLVAAGKIGVTIRRDPKLGVVAT